MPLRLEIVTAERVVFSDDVDMVSAPAAEGRIGILPRHEAMLTILLPGEFHYTKDGVSNPFAISGGFMEVLPDRVTVLADTAERGDEIHEARAEEARRLAEQHDRLETEHAAALASAVPPEALGAAEAARDAAEAEASATRGVLETAETARSAAVAQAAEAARAAQDHEAAHARARRDLVADADGDLGKHATGRADDRAADAAVTD